MPTSRHSHKGLNSKNAMTMTIISSVAILPLLALLMVPTEGWVVPPTANVMGTKQNLMGTTRTSSTLNPSSSSLLARNDDANVDFIESDPGNLVGDSPDLSKDLEMVRVIAKAADGRKADDIVALQVAHVTTLTSFMIIVSGNSRPQNQAIAAAIADDVEEAFGIDENPQGTADSGWMVLDYGNIMVHVMTPKSRLFYNLEGQVRVLS